MRDTRKAIIYTKFNVQWQLTKRHSIVTKLSKISCIQSKKIQDNNNTFKNPLLFLCEQVDFTCTLKNQRKQLKQNNQTNRGRLCLTRLRNWKRRKRGCSKISAHLRHLQIRCLQKQKLQTKHAMKYVTEANSLRRTVKEKTEEVKTVELQLDEA